MQKKNLVLAFLFFLLSCSESKENATSWVSKVSEIEGRSRSSFISVVTKLEQQNYEIGDLLHAAASQNSKGMQELKSMDVIEYGETYRSATLEMMQVYDEYFNQKAPSLVHVLKDSVTATEVTDVMNDYEESLNRCELVYDRLISAQKVLVTQYGLATDDNKKLKVQSLK